MLWELNPALTKNKKIQPSIFVSLAVLSSSFLFCFGEGQKKRENESESGSNFRNKWKMEGKGRREGEGGRRVVDAEQSIFSALLLKRSPFLEKGTLNETSISYRNIVLKLR